MNFWILCLLCVVQGLTEFLPVSSSGHLLLVEQLLGIKENLLLINLFLHLATLLAVVVVYKKIIWKLIKKPFQPLTYKLLMATAVTVLFAVIYKVLNIDAFVTKIYGLCFMITALLLFLTYRFQQKSSVIKSGEMSYKNALIVGIVQGFAVLPGISRSGSTISAMILMGNNEKDSAEFSFLLSVPIIVGGFIVELLSANDLSLTFGSVGVFGYLFAFVLTFVVAMLALKLTIKLLKDKKFNWFSLYVLCVGLLVCGLNLFT